MSATKPKSKEQEIWEILLLYPDLRCTCDEVIREDTIFQAKGHYHHCMLWIVAHAIKVSLRVSNGDKFVFDESRKFGRFQTNHAQSTEVTK
jgi:hypothetical protein